MTDYFVSGYFPDRYWTVSYFLGAEADPGTMAAAISAGASLAAALTAAAQAEENEPSRGGTSGRRGGWRRLEELKPYRPARMRAALSGGARINAGLSAKASGRAGLSGHSGVSAALTAVDRAEEWNRFWLMAA